MDPSWRLISPGEPTCDTRKLLTYGMRLVVVSGVHDPAVSVALDVTEPRQRHHPTVGPTSLHHRLHNNDVLSEHRLEERLEHHPVRLLHHGEEPGSNAVTAVK